MKKNLLAVFLFLAIYIGCKQPEVPKPVILRLGNNEVYTDDFKYVYDKNLTNPSAPEAYSEPKIREYLDLYTNFKLKVIAAINEGVDTTAKFKKELEGYRKQLSKPYLTDNDLIDKLTKEAYDRLNYEVSAQHILINLAPDASDADTATAYNKIMDIRKKAVEQKEDFEKLAKENSDDPSAVKNGGNLGYFTAMQMVYPFESAAYSNPVGSVSMPIRTTFGYHLIKTLDKRPAQGEITVSHILIRLANAKSTDDSAKVKDKIAEIHKKLANNEETWDNLVKQYSEDANTSKKGGLLPPFGTGKMVPEFEKACFTLKDIGQVSEPVLTPYGWHIIKLVDQKYLEDFDKMKANLRTKVSKDSRSAMNRTSLVKKLKIDNMFKEVKKSKDLAFATADKFLPEGTWDFNEANKAFDVPLFMIGSENTKVVEFLKYVRANQSKKPGMKPSRIMNQLYDRFVEDKNIEYEEKRLGKKYPEFKRLLNEYKEGMLLFEMMDRKVWSKAIEDSLGLRQYYDQNPDKYKWDERLEATIFSAIDSNILAQTIKELERGRYYVSDVRIDNIYYDFAKFTIRSESFPVLDKVVGTLNETKDLTMDIEAHTDERGTVERNQKLSQKRAESARDYIVSKNIDGKRITAIGFGKSKPVIQGAKSDKEHQQNRRSTFSAYSSDINVLVKLINKTSSLNLKIIEKKIEKGQDELSNQINWQIGTQYTKIDGRWAYVVVKQLIPPGTKTFDEARGEVTADYQKYLEEQWLAELRLSYPPKVYDMEVKKLVK